MAQPRHDVPVRKLSFPFDDSIPNHWIDDNAAALRPGVLRNLHPTMERLILWHAMEEIEHKNVAFDVLQVTHPSYLLRIAGYVIATLLLFGWTGVATRMLLRQENLPRSEIAEQRRGLRSHQPPEVARIVRDSALAYFRRDFHPSQIDDLPLAHSRLGDIGLADEGAAGGGGATAGVESGLATARASATPAA